ncbi:MAG: hypothetical protein LH471_06750 [Salinibacterium sp.]|nr:hypothetical protein [Salinibacterium sp.]
MRTDLAFTAFLLVLEYQGDYHRTKAQWRKDLTRRSRPEALGWYVMEIHADDLIDPEELAARVLTVLSPDGPASPRLLTRSPDSRSARGCGVGRGAVRDAAGAERVLSVRRGIH